MGTYIIIHMGQIVWKAVCTQEIAEGELDKYGQCLGEQFVTLCKVIK